MNNSVAVIGKNAVQTALQRIFISKGVCSELIDPSEPLTLSGRLQSFDSVVLPFPSKDDNISFIKEHEREGLFEKNQLIIGGMIPEKVINHLEKAYVRVADYFLDEAYVLKNAYLTYQGVLRLLSENTDSFLAEKTVLVTGYGRIAKPLCLALRTLGMKVYVAVRSDIQSAEAGMMGFNTLKINSMKGALFYFDYIFNTVPFNIFDEKDIRHLKNSCVYFEIASFPYGALSEHFGFYGKKYILSSALPGKFYPSGVAENIAEYLSRKGIIK
ncbi:MAG: hypothetical protein E7544_04565 [Ruminococcaceae bacterium]|nr:hypothetical protein [Oscillospiraceae bacterium]